MTNEITGTVSCWRFILSGDAYTAPEVRRFHLQGIVAEAPPERNKATTSPIVAIDGPIVTTRSGSRYRLDGPAERGWAPEGVSVYESLEEGLRANPGVALG